MANPPRKTYLDQPAPVQTALTKSNAYTVEQEQARQRQAEQAKIDDMSSFSRGLETGFAGIGESYHGAAAVTKALVGDEQGAMDSAERAQLYAEGAQQYAPEISSLKDVDSVSDALSFAAGALGQMAPSLAAVITGGGAGAVVGRQLGQRLLRNYTAKQLKKRGLAATRQNLAAQGAQSGAKVGALQTGAALEQGQLGSQLLDPEFKAESIFGRELSQRERAVLALAGGEVAGRLEAIPVLGIMGRYGLGKAAGDQIKKTLASEAGKQALSEGTTEAAQQLIQRSVMAVADKNREVLGAEGVQELVDAFAMGAVGGGVVGGVGRVLSPNLAEPADPGALTTGQDTDFVVGADGQARPVAPWEQAADITPERAAEFMQQRRAEFSDSLRNMEIDDDPAGFTMRDIESEVFGETPAEYEDFLAYIDDQQFGQQGEEALTPTRFGAIDDEGAVQQMAAERMEGMRSGQLQPNIQYEKVTRDSRGEVLRELPYQEGSAPYTRALDKAGEGFIGRDYSEVVQEEAQRRYPGDPQAQRDYITRQAQVISESRSTQKWKIQKGQQARDYLSRFRVIQGPDTETGTGRGALGAVPGDLGLATEELSRSYGEIKDREGKPITDRTELNKERNLRKIIRSYNTDNFNQGFTENKDIRLPNDKVLNAMSLTLAMQPKMNAAQQQQGDKPLAARVGEWFTAGLASLAENGAATINPDTVPATTVLYQQGKKQITWGQAREAMTRGEAVPAPSQRTELQQREVDQDLTRDRADMDEIQGRGIEHGVVEQAKVQPIRRDARGRETQVVMEERQGEKFEAEPTGEQIRSKGREQVAAINKAGKRLLNANVAPDGRLVWDPQLAKDLVAAGIIQDTKQIFAVPGTKVKPLKSAKWRGARKQRLIKMLRQKKAAIIERSNRTMNKGKTTPHEKVMKAERQRLKEEHGVLSTMDIKVPPKQLELFTHAAIPLRKSGKLAQEQAKQQEKQREALLKEIKAEEARAQKAMEAAKTRMAEERASRHAAAVTRLRKALLNLARAKKAQVERKLKAQQKVDDLKNQDLTEGDPLKRGMRKDTYQKWYDNVKGPRQKLDQMLADLAAKLKLTPMRMATPNEMQAKMVENPEWAKKVLRGRILGSTFTTIEGDTVIYISPTLKGATQRFAVLAHEVGHQVFKQRWANASKDTKDRIWADFEKWRDAQTGSRGDVRASKMAYSLVSTMAFDRTLINDLPAEQRKYLMDFEEWFADQTSRYFESSEAPRSFVGKYFKGVANYLKALYQELKDAGFLPEQSIKDFYDNLFMDPVDATQAVGDTVADVVEQNDPPPEARLSQEQLDRIKRLAKAMFRKENVQDRSDERLGREIMLIAMMASNYGDDMNAAATAYAYNNLLNAGERKTVARAFGTKAMVNRVRRALLDAGDPQAAKRVIQDPEALIVHGYHLWESGALQLGPKTNTMFQRLRSRIMKILGVVSDGERAEQIFAALKNDEVLVRAELGNTSPTFSSPNQLVNNNLQRAVAGFRALGEFIAPTMEKVFQSAYGRMAGTKNPWLLKLARDFYVPPGSQGVKEGWFESKNAKLAEYHNRVGRILRGKDDAFKKKVATAMASGKWSDDAEVKAVQEQLKTLMEDMRKYATEATVVLGDRSRNEAGYWPWVFDTEALLREPRVFMRMLADTMSDEFANQYVERMRGVATMQQKTDPLGKPIPRDQLVTPGEKMKIARAIYAAILQSKGLGDAPHIADYTAASHTPYMGAHDTRILDFLKNAEGFEKFLSSDLDKTLISYIDQTVKRSEFARRFSDDGAKIKMLLKRAKAAGMTAAEHKMADQYVQAMLGTLGGDISPALRKGMSYVMVYENLRLLSMSLFSSLVDPNGILVRSGSWQDTMVGFREMTKDLAGWSKRLKGEGGKTDARLLAETLGIVEDSIAKEALGYEYGGAYMSGFAKNINEKWFEITGIAGFTRMTRVMATGAAQNFLKRHKQGLDRDSKRYLDELGTRAEDIQLDQQGNIKILTEEQRRNASKRELERDDRVRNAIRRFVDEAILRPDSAQRPIYGSDPHFMLVFHLKGFMYSFYERIMKRAWSEAVEHGRVAPIASLGMYIPGMIAADMVRDAVKDAFGDQDDDRKDNWTVGDWVSHGVDRSGLYGPYVTLLDDSAEDYTKWGKMPGLSMAGPSAEHLVDILSMKGGLDTQLARALPGQNLVRPLSDSFMSNFE